MWEYDWEQAVNAWLHEGNRDETLATWRTYFETAPSNEKVEYLTMTNSFNNPGRYEIPYPPAVDLPKGSLVLDPADPFDAALIPIVETNRKKRKDYAADGDPFSNFTTSSDFLGLAGFGPTEAALFNVTQKLARLKALRANGRMHRAANESVADTYLDLAVYGILTYAIYRSLAEGARDDAH
jgi:hypothetical protein